MQKAYTGTIIKNAPAITPILATQIDIDNITEETRFLAVNLTNKILKTRIIVGPTNPNKNFNGTPKSWNYIPNDLSLLYRK
jgi:hypothetical protein